MAGEKVIILTENKRLLKALLQSVKQKNLEYETEIMSLYDMDHIKKMITTTKNTRFIREAFGSFIKENNGPPLCIILDYKFDFGLDESLDPDNMKLLRTFAISSVILVNISHLVYNVSNIVLIGSLEHLKQLEMFKSNPHLIFKIVKTENPQLNKMLDDAVKDPDKIKSLLSINYILMDEKNDCLSASNKLEVIFDKLIQKRQSLINLKMGKNQTGIITDHHEPARIIYKISDSRMYVSGKTFDIQDNSKFNKYRENIIYIHGYYIQNNASKVSDRLERFIIDDLPKIKSISIDTEINISLEEHTIIDGGIAPALNILLSIKLKDFRNIRLITSPVNFNKMENSPGFISLRNYILKKL